MGASWNEICNDCGKKFRASNGGGFVFHLLHCDNCGGEKKISFMDIGEIHLKYIKGLDKPYCIATAGYDQYIQDTYLGDPIAKDDYYRLVEEFAGKCECGGNYTFNARHRCPNCKSTNYEPTGDLLLYD